MQFGKIAVVTGASAGVGRAAARAFAAKGYDVALMARGIDGLRAAAAEVEALGRRALVQPVDVADAEAVQHAADQVERELGPIDVWVNNAMTSVFSRFVDMQLDEFKRVTEVTYLGYVHGTYAALRHMRPRNRGVIVQVGSALAYRGIPLQSAYCGAKHAIQGFTESVRCELRHDGIDVRLTMVQMPALNTPQFGWVKSRLPRKAQPVPPIYQPEVAAAAIVWAAEHKRRQLFVGVSTEIAIHGNKFFAALGDRYLAKRGVESQQYDGHADPDRPHNLWHPLAGDHGAHGDFDARATGRSLQLWLTERRGRLAAAAAGAALGFAARRTYGVKTGPSAAEATGVLDSSQTA